MWRPSNPNTVVVLNVSEPVAMPWLDKRRAVLLMWYPGDEGGRASADLLLGRANPAGRLPFTWPRRLEDGPANDPAHPERTLARHRRQDHATPRACSSAIAGSIGSGSSRCSRSASALSIRSFDYRDLTVSPAADGGLDASFELRNTGRRRQR